MKLSTFFKTIALSGLLCFGSLLSQATIRITANQTKPNCVGTCDATINLSVSGGVIPYSYLWSNGAQTANIGNLCAGNYTVTVTDFTGATAVQTRQIRDPYPVKANLSSTNVSCNGSCNGTMTSTPTGGTGPYTYLWSTGSTGSSISQLCPATYTVTVTDSHGCTTICRKAITQPSPLCASVSKVNATCYNSCNGTAQASGSGGTSPYSYLWSNGSTSAQIGSLCAGNYTVTVSDAKGCSIMKSVTVGQPSSPVSAEITLVHAICVDSCNGALSVSANGGSGSFTYLWSNSATSNGISNLCAGIYTVTVTDIKGCTTVKSYDLHGTPVLVTATGSDASCHELCNGSAVAVASGTGPLSYLWSDNETSSSVSNLCSGIVTVTVTDSLGCSGSDTATVGQPTTLNASCQTTSNESAPAAADGSITASATGGTMPYTYLWSNSSTSSTINNLTAGVYTCTITDAHGCTAVTSCSIETEASCGGFRTQTQGGWGQCQLNGHNPGQYLHDNFSLAFPAGLTVGCNYTLHLSLSTDVCGWLPSGTTPRALNANYTNPAGVYNNVLAAQVVTLTINVGFDMYDSNFGSSGTLLKNQVITTGTFAGWTVKQLLDTANAVLGGCPSLYSASSINDAATAINENYDDGNTDNGFLTCPNVSLRVRKVVAGTAHLYPNPFNSNLDIKLGNGRSAKVTISDMTGKINDIIEVNGSISYSADKLVPGVYMVNLQYTDGSNEFIKIVKTN